MNCSQFRIALLTLILGIVSVPFCNDLYEKWTAIPINLPQAASGSVMIVEPKQLDEMPIGGGAGCGGVEEDNLPVKQIPVIRKKKSK
jgi:hypothetical protein